MNRIIKLSPWALLAIISFIVIYACSYYAHTNYRALAFDQDIFYVIGRNWAEGKLPYVTAWDSKGPYIFFFNMLGYLITKSDIGVVLLESINFTLVSWCSYFFLGKYCSKKTSFIYTLFFIASYTIINSGGNQVGDCNLLLSVISIFLVYNWTRKYQDSIIEHPWKYAFIYGLFFASCLLSRLTNAVAICASILAIASILVFHKKWNNLIINGIAFIAGCFTFALPFIIYFNIHNALSDMWYATFLYNIEYAIHSQPNAVTDTHFPLIYFTLYNISILSVLLSGIMAINCNARKKITYIWGFIAICTICWIIKSYANANYTISFLPIQFVSFIELSTLYKIDKKKLYLVGIYMISIVIIIGTGNYIRTTMCYESVARDMKKDAQYQIDMIKDIPKEDSFIFYNGLPYIYATQNIRPYYPYWICQDWAIENGISLRSKVRDCYAKGDAKWIIVLDYEHSNIKDILLDRYSISKKDKKNKLTLFRLK